MNCSQVTELISSYIDGMLEGRVRGTVDSHLSTCPDCRAELVQIRTMLAATAQVQQVDPPSHLKDRILQSVADLRECARIQDLFSAYIDNEASGPDRSLVQHHIAACKDCARELSAMQALVREAAAIASVEPPAQLRQLIVAATTASSLSLTRSLAWLRGLASTRAVQWATGSAAAGFIAFGLVCNFSQSPQGTAVLRPLASNESSAVVRVVPAGEPRESTGQLAMSSAAVLTPKSMRQYAMAQPSEAAVREWARDVKSVSMPAVPEMDRPVPEAPKADESIAPEPVVERKHEEQKPPAPEPVKQDPPRIEKDPLVKVAVVSPAVSSDNGEWIRQMKSQAALHVANSGKTQLRTTNTQ